MAFKLAQTFYVDKTSVRDAEHVTVTSIDLYFKKKPLEKSNRSGITAPGVTINVCQVRDDDIPDVTKVMENGTSRLGYNEVVATTDASIAARFSFTKPLILDTNKSYAVLVTCDGDEEFEFWTCREGERIVGTNTTTTGATARNVGSYYEYTSQSTSSTTISEQWKPLTNVDVKFAVNIGVYSDSVTDDNINTTYLLPSDPTEFIVYDRYNYKTSNRNDVAIGEMVFQETPVQYGTIVVSANSTSITSSTNVNFTQLLTPSESATQGSAGSDPYITQKSYIVLRNGANAEIREVAQILSNNQIVVDRVPSFSSNNATFSVTAAGKLNYHGYHWYTGRWYDQTSNSWDKYDGRRVDILKLTQPNSNSTVRFVNNMVESITINSGGTGYSNNDYIVVYPQITSNTSDPNDIAYIPSYSNATANVVTNGSGTIVGIAITNAGFGLTGNVVLSAVTSSGTGANLAVTIGATLRSEKSNSYFGNCIVANVPVHRTYPHCHILTNQSHTFRMFQHFPYYVMPGKEHLMHVASPASKREVDVFKNTDTYDLQSNDGRVYVLASRSNEVLTPNVVIQTSSGITTNTSVQCSSLIEVAINSNNAFSLPLLVTDDVYNYKYIINNDFTNERKSQGKALARHISTKITFAESRRAEDVIVYIDAYRPAGTDVKVYAKIQNKADTDAFDDKDWTELELKSNNGSVYSSLTDETNTIEYMYGIPSMPTSVFVGAGSVTTNLSSTTVTGVGTQFVSQFQSNDLVKIYSPLFPQNYFVTTISSVTNNASMSISDPVSNSSYVGSGFKIDLVGRNANGSNPEVGGPHQAWCNQSNDNVVRYYNSNMAKFDTYNTFQVKLVMTSNNISIVPKIENIRAVGVSA